MIEFRSVSKAYSDGTVAASGFSLEMPSHRTVALVGSSGSGKTTLLRMVNRMVDPTEGAFLIDERDVAELDPCDCAARSATCCSPAACCRTAPSSTTSPPCRCSTASDVATPARPAST